MVISRNQAINIILVIIRLKGRDLFMAGLISNFQWTTIVSSAIPIESLLGNRKVAAISSTVSTTQVSVRHASHSFVISFIQRLI